MRERVALGVSVALIGVLSACGRSPAGNTVTAPTAPAALFSLSVTVQDQVGTPVNGVTASIATGPNQGSKGTNLNSPFVLPNLTPGTFVLDIQSPPYIFKTASVTLTGNQSVTVILPYTPTELTGQITSADTSMPIPGATVRMNGRYQTQADGSGHYVLDGKLDLGSLTTGSNILQVVADGYDTPTQYIRSTSMDESAHAVQWFAVGTSVQVSVSPNDSLCSNNTQDPSFGNNLYVCRTLHTTAPAGGPITVEAIGASGSHYALEVESGNHDCCSLDNPTTFGVTNGAEIVVNVELPSTATSSQTFTVTATMSGQALPLAWRTFPSLVAAPPRVAPGHPRGRQ